MAIIAADKNFDIYLTSTPPDQLRFRVLNADSSFKARLSMHYFTPNRIDLYKNNEFVAPTNAYYSKGNMLLTDPSSNLSYYKPTYNNTSGTNLFAKNDRKVFFTIGGGDVIDLKMTKVLNIKFGVPAVTEDAFFNSANLVQNLADLLGVDASKIRKVEIVRATSRKRRNARDSGLIQIVLTIYDDAAQLLTDQANINTTTNQLKELEASIINRYATGQLQSDAQKKLNISLDQFIIQKASSANVTEVEITKLKKISVVQEANNCDAQVPCKVQPILQVLDENVSFLFVIILKCYSLWYEVFVFLKALYFMFMKCLKKLDISKIVLLRKKITTF